ncbi:ATP phosphoribosyltransferase [Enterococcus sp. BWT-B8]|uniref:ATP phosphoribosyltransferase n=1 Tax=unclassified Enterococcus TaxID=2608891 RepID=UPI001E33AA77|nr:MULTISPECIES: ATP phosphoribosyltransferase [unclassified Enterococcus]MCB5953121.1 ATP phosphoribosyltransferase [Enterococcus sp. BWT-B8]MCB5956149.1 ATP phosphoribosyltransferase [Enterococcus sp. CWB-B31]
MSNLTIALTKGRLERQTLELFEKAGIDVSFMNDKQRKLVFHNADQSLTFLLVKAADVATYVRHGVADLGVVGKDVLFEHPHGYYEMLDLEIGKCKFSVASVGTYQPHDHKRKRIATKYPTIASDYFREKGEDVEIIKIEGSVEIAPVLGLADAIVDIVETGTTLKENGLEIYEDICDISARIIVNKATLKRKRQAIFELFQQLETVIGKEG